MTPVTGGHSVATGLSGPVARCRTVCRLWGHLSTAHSEFVSGKCTEVTVHRRDKEGIGRNHCEPAYDYLSTFDERKDSNPNE